MVIGIQSVYCLVDESRVIAKKRKMSNARITPTVQYQHQRVNQQKCRSTYNE